MLSRRSTLLALAGALGYWLRPQESYAGVARAARLDELCRMSDRALLGTTRQIDCQWEVIGGRRRIVSYNLVQVEEAWAGDRKGTQLTVRTLGGRVGDIGQIVHGEAFLELNQPAVLFLTPLGSGIHVVSAMAQGHYPVIDRDGERRLRASPRLPSLLRDKQSAAKELAGRRLAPARERIVEVWGNARR